MRAVCAVRNGVHAAGAIDVIWSSAGCQHQVYGPRGRVLWSVRVDHEGCNYGDKESFYRNAIVGPQLKGMGGSGIRSRGDVFLHQDSLYWLT